MNLKGRLLSEEGEQMKKLVILVCSLICFQIMYPSILDDIKEGFEGFGHGVKDLGEKTFKGLKGIGEKVIEEVKDLGETAINRIKGCAEVTELGTAWAASTGALQLAKGVLEGSEIVGKKAAFDAAKNFLDAAEKSAEATLKLADIMAKGLEEGFNIKCFRFVGKIEELEFEMQAKILGKDITIREKVDFNDVKSLAEKIINILKDKVLKL